MGLTGDSKSDGVVTIDRMNRVTILLDGPPTLVMFWPSVGRTGTPGSQKPRQAAEGVRAGGSRSPPQYVDVEGVTDPGAFAVVLDGDCMRPKYRSGEVLVFSRLAPVRSGDDCLVVFYHSESGGLCQWFKRVFLEAGGSVRLQPLNPRYGSFTLEASNVLAIIRAVARADGSPVGRPAAAERLALPAKMGGQAREARSRSARSEKSPCLALTT
ncbi:MAG: S24 family peptidase [Planctomycetota bacterium]|nr:S24 family peptidase [Planctomycetota bacterium]